MRALILVFAAAMLAGVGAARATTDDVTVTGTKLTEQAARERADSFVRQLQIANSGKQLGRWHGPICPKVIGAPEQEAKRFMRRIAAIARPLGVAAQFANCNANFIVILTDDSTKLIDKIERNVPAPPSTLDPIAFRKLLHDDAPIRWWYRFGISAPEGGFLPSPVGASDGQPIVFQPNETPRIKVPAVRSISAALIVIDRRKLLGVPYDTLSAYAAFVGLAEIVAPKQAPPYSVLALCDESSCPVAPSFTDAALLETVYKTEDQRDGLYHRIAVTNALAARLEGK